MSAPAAADRIKRIAAAAALPLAGGAAAALLAALWPGSDQDAGAAELARCLLAGAGAAALAAGGAWLERRRWRRRVSAWIVQAGKLAEGPEREEEGPEAASAAPGPDRSPATLEEQLMADALRRGAGMIRQLRTTRRLMVAEVAHELRSPLAVIRASLDNALYEQRPLPPERLAVLSEQAAAMSRLVQDLQDLSLSESGRLRIEKEWFEPAAAAASAIELLQPEADDRGVELVAELDVKLLLYGDEKRFSQLLLNLLGNAIRHARSRVTVSASASGAELVLRVRDDGWGFEPEEAEQLFQRYYRKPTYADGSPAPRGLGLGLAVVRGIAQAHDGSVEVESRVGEGAAFTARLPLFRE
ncbi:HAMP domain-containing histidine kinase [Paenibacillus albicereus]|uniref:histidine kinase n=1 Tax=Paenibacillus albicereus TaxID=2726185 RepID=A0A6H2GXJ2_9BACL|nr:HAMP domain-containing sensor histidine kinase [Paenibacillus albicereus]QJC52117.1 HAMP domain-containing histidine kinase [Paenibacillus albicereus]